MKINFFSKKNKQNSNNNTKAHRYNLIYNKNIENFISVLILMNIHKLLEYKNHWNYDTLTNIYNDSKQNIYIVYFYL